MDNSIFFHHISLSWNDVERDVHTLYTKLDHLMHPAFIVMGRGGWASARMLLAHYDRDNKPYVIKSIIVGYEHYGTINERLRFKQPLALSCVEELQAHQGPVILFDSIVTSGQSFAFAKAQLEEETGRDILTVALHQVEQDPAAIPPWRQGEFARVDIVGRSFPPQKPDLFVDYPWE